MGDAGLSHGRRLPTSASSWDFAHSSFLATRPRRQVRASRRCRRVASADRCLGIEGGGALPGSGERGSRRRRLVTQQVPAPAGPSDLSSFQEAPYARPTLTGSQGTQKHRSPPVRKNWRASLSCAKPQQGMPKSCAGQAILSRPRGRFLRGQRRSLVCVFLRRQPSANRQPPALRARVAIATTGTSS